MILLAALLHALYGVADERRESDAPDAALDLRLAFALTQLLLDAGLADAAGCVVVATWRTPNHVFFEVVCAERVRMSLCTVLARTLSRPFPATGQAWLLNQHEADALIERSGRSPAAQTSDPAYKIFR